MLRGIHKASTTWLGKLVMGTIVGGLIIAFGIWGIGDVFRGFGRPPAVRAIAAAERLHRGALHRRGAPPDAAPPARRQRGRRAERAQSHARGRQPLSE